MKYTLESLNMMIPAELEGVRERGDEYRRVLTDSVISLLTTPAGWDVNGEYRCEFGGLCPVQLRYAPQDSQEFFHCVCSPGEALPEWTVFLLSADGALLRFLHHTDRLQPEAVSNLLAQVAGMSRFNCTAATVADLLAGEVAA
jgi:hypothetical protein